MADINEFDSLTTNRDESGLSIGEKLERLVPLIKSMFADSISQHITEQAVTNLLSDERIQTNSEITAAIATAAAQGKQQAVDEIMGGEVSTSLDTIREIATEVTDIDGLLSGVVSDLASKATITALQAVAADVTSLQAAMLTKASTTHNHDAAYLGKTATAANSLKLGNQLPEYYAPASAATGRTASTISDWNDAINNGIFMGLDASHAPGSGWWMGEVCRHSDDWITQRVWDFTSYRKIYFRYCSGGTWSAWIQTSGTNFQVWHQDNLDPASLGVPVGTVIAFAGDVCPPRFMFGHGQLISRVTYADLFSVFGTRYGAGDGSTTFGVPDYRAEFMRGLDNGRGVDAGRVLGSWQDQAVGPHSHTVQGANGSGAQSSNYPIASAVAASQTTSTTGSGIGSETRPRNISVNFCIKY